MRRKQYTSKACTFYLFEGNHLLLNKNIEGIANSIIRKLNSKILDKNIKGNM
ncbi:Thioesterase [Bacillus cereus F65185]|nr:Thioesterase [Bacillus cereus F65185]EKS7870114.1 hypothetical protein [Bacillus cereus]